MASYLLVLFCVLGVAFGDIKDSRIFGGSNAQQGQFKYQVSIRYNNHHICGGSILSPRTILTAASCNIPTLNGLTVVAGATRLSQGGTTHTVLQFRPHEYFNDRTLENDIALIYLNFPIQYTELAQPIALATRNLADYSFGVISGWGFSGYPGGNPDNLQFLNARALSYNDCKSLNHGIMYFSKYCTLNGPGQGVCAEDVGGPLVANGQLHGIISSATSCAIGYPDFFTNVYMFVGWIERYTILC